MDLRNLESNNSFLPVSAPTGNGRGQGSQTQRNRTDQISKAHKILIDDANRLADLNEESFVLTPREGRNLYSQDQSIDKSKIMQN